MHVSEVICYAGYGCSGYPVSDRDAGGTQLIKYRIEQLEKKVEKHNSVVERTFLLEEKVKVANHRIEDLEGKVE